MAYTPREIKDRVAVGDDIFIVEDLGNNRIKLIPAPTHVSEAGTPVNKALLQHMENHLVPPGGIIMWSGAINDIPVGWALCDGSNGTPDLRDRFIVGAGESYNVGNTGWANRVTLNTLQIPSHSHSGSTSSTGAHNHTGTTSLNQVGDQNVTGNIHTVTGRQDDAINKTSSSVGWGAVTAINLTAINTNHLHTFTTSSNGSHSHDITIGDTGGDQPHENRPPYYALAYIMKL